mmetsp:Transcript_77353/g.107506  ORF Transcript_77353/g.107506 Transcript_77353/m.107506 type:complete len:126 (+) Transcript_77353:73-450(+)
MDYRLKFVSFSERLEAKYPGLKVQGKELGAAWMMPLKQVGLALVVGAFAHYVLGFELRPAMMYSLVCSALMMNLIPGRLVGKGGFEVTFIDDREGSKPFLIHSKYDTGQFPTIEELEARVARLVK